MKAADIIENLLVAQAMVLDLPDEAIDLDQWANEEHVESQGHTCGSVGCFGGWVAVHPHFKKQGVTADRYDGYPVMRGHTFPSNVSLELFGDWEMFGSRRRPRISQRREILARIERALNKAVAA